MIDSGTVVPRRPIRIDDLLTLHLKISEVLQQKIQQEKLRLEERLERLQTPVSERRPYPPVPPKYRNPDQPSEIWVGGWQAASLAGRAIEIGKADRGFQDPGSEQEANQR